jgi:nucleotide-binding universal stress UspA family protein
VGFDRTAASLAALGKAAEIGEHLGAELHVVHAVDLSDYPIDPDDEDWEPRAATNLEDERQKVSTTLARYPWGWSYLALRGEPAEALNRVAEQFDATMIVVGVRSPGWRHLLERLAGPSVSHRLINHGHRPVLVVSCRPPG